RRTIFSWVAFYHVIASRLYLVHNNYRRHLNRLGDGCISAGILIARTRKLLVISKHLSTGADRLDVAGKESLSNKAMRDSEYVELCLATPLDIKIDGDSDGWTIVTATYAETTGACEDRRELIAARTKLLPSSHMGPGNLRQSVRTLSSAVTKSAISFSPMMSGGKILSTSMACPAT